MWISIQNIFRDANITVSQCPAIGLSRPYITTVAASVTLLLDTLLLTLFSSVRLWKVFPSRRAQVPSVADAGAYR